MLELYQTSVGFSGLRPRIDFTIYIFFRSRKKKISVNNNLWHIWDAEILKEKHSKYSCYPSQFPITTSTWMGYEIEYSKYKKGANKVLSQASDIGVETNGFA